MQTRSKSVIPTGDRRSYAAAALSAMGVLPSLAADASFKFSKRDLAKQPDRSKTRREAPSDATNESEPGDTSPLSTSAKAPSRGALLTGIRVAPLSDASKASNLHADAVDINESISTGRRGRSLSAPLGIRSPTTAGDAAEHQSTAEAAKASDGGMPEGVHLSRRRQC